MAVKTREASYEKRVQIQTLRNLAGWTLEEIATHPEIQFHRTTVGRICQQPAKSVKIYRRGRKGKISNAQRRQLIRIATLNAEYRRKPIEEIGRLAGIDASLRTLRQALRSAGYNRRVARKKPFLNAAKKYARLHWALEHQYMTVEDWRRVIWTDESYIRMDGRGGRVYVTRTSAEEFHEDCLVPKFQNKNSVMIWGAICGIDGGSCSPVVLWNKKDWGNITSDSYCEHVLLPVLHPYWCQQSAKTGLCSLVMEDGASAHRAKKTQAVREHCGIYSLRWVASSPDMNPIEAIWRKIKGRLNKRADRATDIEGVMAQIQEEWDAITLDEILDLVDSMPDRIAALIAAEGGHTRY